MREPAGDALEIGEHTVAPLIMQAIKGGTEKLVVIHRKDLEPEWNLETFLERFQLGCRAEIGRQVFTRRTPESFKMHDSVLIRINKR
jgi:hypothetical protein